MTSSLLFHVCTTILTLLILVDHIAQAGNCFYQRTNDLCYELSEMDAPEEQCTGLYYSDDNLNELDGYVYAKKCRDVNVSHKPCDVDCGLGQECQWINGEEMCVCSEKSCLANKHDQQSLCASNNMTFISECAMEAWKCSHEQSSLHKRYDGKCQKDCGHVECPNDKVCLLVRNTGEPICYPKKHCDPTLDPEPVCGTNGITYPNICAMRLSPDRRGRTPDMAHKGPCENECRPDLCQSDERCVYSKRLNPVCIRCKYPSGFLAHSGECSTDIPVCGDDGYLYRNYCSILIDQCEKNHYITIIDYGTCPTRKSKHILRNKINYWNRFTNYSNE